LPFGFRLLLALSFLHPKMSASPLKILLVEDDELFRLGLHVRLQQEAGFELVAEAEDGETAIALAKQHSLNIVVLDIGLPGMSGIETCRQLRELNPTLPILVLTSHREKTLITRMIEAGAQGYCLKGSPSEVLILAIRSVAAGASWWDSTATTEIRAAFDANSSPFKSSDRTLPSLTRREQEILALIASGRTNQEIAEKFYITLGTVRVHVHSILHKLQVRDRTQAAILAIQQKLIDADLLSNPEDTH
jgi:two-component system, NarL family, response regulator